MTSSIFLSPIGSIRITSDGQVLTRLDLLPPGEVAGAPIPERCSVLSEAIEQLQAYFTGARRAFELPLAKPPTPAGPRLRAAIAAVCYGETTSYGELARRYNSSPRAIGQACRRNPFPILVPCHRVVGAAGELGQYSAGAGPATKRWLLVHERR